MPVTPSHVVAVLPLLGRSGRVPAAALVIGSMAPDYPWFLTGGRTATFSHSIVGVLTVDLLVGLVAVAAWRLWVHPPVRDLLPPAVGDRLPRPVGLVARDLPWAALGVVLGALTHIGWDEFTHAGRAGVEAVAWLGDEHAGLPGYKWAQYLSGVLGGVVLLVWGARRLSRTPPVPPDASASTSRERRTAWLLVCGALVAGAAVGLVTGGTRLETLLFGAVTRGGLGAVVGLALACVLWWVRVSSRGSRASLVTAAPRRRGAVRAAGRAPDTPGDGGPRS